MADHPDITPDELKDALAVFLATGSYTKAAQAIGRDRVGTMQALKRASSDNVRQRVYARTLDAVLAEVASAQRLAIRKNRKALGDPKRCEGATFALNDTMAKASTARTALAKMTGEHAADKIDANVNAQVVVLPPLDNVRPADAQDPLAAEPRSSDEVSR